MITEYKCRPIANILSAGMVKLGTYIDHIELCYMGYLGLQLFHLSKRSNRTEILGAFQHSLTFISLFTCIIAPPHDIPKTETQQ